MRKRNKAITIRLSEEEFAQLENKVKQSGQTQQNFIIDACLKGQITSADEITEMRNKNKLLADMDKQLRGMGTNLNQMAHIANGQGIIPSAEKLVQIASEVSQIKREVSEEWLSTRQSISRPNHTEPCETV